MTRGGGRGGGGEEEEDGGGQNILVKEITETGLFNVFPLR